MGYERLCRSSPASLMQSSGIFGLYCAFSLVVLLVESFLPPNPKRLVVSKIALVASAIALLFSADLTCSTCQWPLRVLRVFSLFVLSFAVTLLSFAILSPNGSQWNLPLQI